MYKTLISLLTIGLLRNNVKTDNDNECAKYGCNDIIDADLTTVSVVLPRNNLKQLIEFNYW